MGPKTLTPTSPVCAIHLKYMPISSPSQVRASTTALILNAKTMREFTFRFFHGPGQWQSPDERGITRPLSHPVVLQLRHHVLVVVHSGGRAGGDVPERHGWTDVDAAGWVMTTHHVGLVAARHVQPGNWLAVPVENSGVGVGPQPEERAEAAG